MKALDLQSYHSNLKVTKTATLSYSLSLNSAGLHEILALQRKGEREGKEGGKEGKERREEGGSQGGRKRENECGCISVSVCMCIHVYSSIHSRGDQRTTSGAVFFLYFGKEE